MKLNIKHTFSSIGAALRRFGRAVRRFWRGSGIRMRLGIVFIALALLLTGVYFTVSALLPPKTQGYTSVDDLFGVYRRENIQGIKFHALEDGEYVDYEIKRNEEKQEFSDGTSITTSVFRLFLDGEAYVHLELDEEALSYLFVYAGTNNVSAPIISAPEEGDADYEIKMTAYRRKLAEYKLDPDTSPYYELTAVDGEVFRVYYGIATPNGGGYYVLLDGVDTVYASIETESCSIGGALRDGPEQFVSPALMYGSTEQYACYFPDMFMQLDHERITLSGTPVTEGVSVGVTNRREDGTESSLVFTMDEDCPSVIKDALLGKVIGPCEVRFDYTYPDDYGEDTDKSSVALRGTTVSYHVTAINYVETSRDVYTITYINPAVRDEYRANENFYFLGPASLTSMVPNTDTFFTILENVMELNGNAVHIGLSADAVTEYGLYKHTIAFSYPISLVIDDEMNVLEKDPDGSGKTTEYWTSILFISDITENGTRYVGSNDFGLILEVDAAPLSFLDSSLLSLTTDSVLKVKDTSIETLTFYWNYGTLPELSSTTTITCTTEQYQASQNSSPTTILGGATAIQNGERIPLDVDDYAQFFLQLLYLQYREETTLSDEEIAALLADRSSCILELAVGFTDDSSLQFRFIPVSGGRILVLLSPDHGVAMTGRFLIYTGDFDAWVANFVRLMRGESVNHQTRH